MHATLATWWSANRPRFVYLHMYGQTQAVLLVPSPVQDAMLRVADSVGDIVLVARAITCRDCFDAMYGKAAAAAGSIKTQDEFVRLANDLEAIRQANEAMHREAGPSWN